MYIAGKKFVPYESTDELWVLTVYYNPCGYRSRRSTYDTFIKTMALSGINVLTIECAFGDDPFELPDSPTVVKIRSSSLLWQKERLLNIGAQYLPDSCKHIAWVDCDIVFMNKSWARVTCELLNTTCAIVQPWTQCVRLAKGDVLPKIPDSVDSFAAVTVENISTLNCGRYDRHGHTGYAWAMRRDIFDKVGLYEFAVSGSSDHFMAHAIYNEYGFCVENALKHDPIQIANLKSWGKKFFQEVQGKLGAVPGVAYHLWHGNHSRREYFSRMWKITEFGFNPETDLLSLPGKPLEWMPNVKETKPELVSYFASYFAARQEDIE